MLERTHAITNEVLQPITFVLAYPIVLEFLSCWKVTVTETDFLIENMIY